MKRILLRVAIGILVLFVLGLLMVSLFLDGAVKRAVETLGPKLTKVDIKLDNVSLSLLSGSGAIKGLVVGNPEGFKTPQAIKIGTARLELRPASLLSDKIVIRSFSMDAPEITLEQGFGGNNLKKLLANIQSSSSAETNTPSGQKAAKKFEVDDLKITGGRVNVSVSGMSGKSIPVPLPEIHLTGLGTGPDGITGAELAKVVLQSIEKGAAHSADAAISDFGKSASALTGDLNKNATGAVGSLKKSLGDFFKKK